MSENKSESLSNQYIVVTIGVEQYGINIQYVDNLSLIHI